MLFRLIIQNFIIASRFLKKTMKESNDPYRDPMTKLARCQQIARYEFAASILNRCNVVVDAACGVGYGSRLLADKANLVLSFDKNYEFINYSREHFPADNIANMQTDLNSGLPLSSKSVDAIVSLETIEHLEAPFTFLESCYEALSETGIMVLSFPNPRNSNNHSNGYHRDRFELSELTQWLQAHFRFVDMMGQGIIIGSILGHLYKKGFKSGISQNHAHIKGVSDNIPFLERFGSYISSHQINTSQYIVIKAVK